MTSLRGTQQHHRGSQRATNPPQRSAPVPYFSCSNAKGSVNFFGSSLMESFRIGRIAIFAKTFDLLKSPSASFVISAVPAEKSKRISPHSSSSFAYCQLSKADSFFRFPYFCFLAVQARMQQYQPFSSTSINSVTFLYTRSFFAYRERFCRFFCVSFA